MMTTRNESTSSTKTSASKCSEVDIEIETRKIKTKTSQTTRTMATITSDPGILCFHHCNVKVFCFTLPHTCPQCKTVLATPADTDTSSTGAACNNRRKTEKKSNNNSSKADEVLAIDSNKVIRNADNVAAEENEISNSTDSKKDDDDKKCFSSTSTNSRLLPFRLPYPFIRANQYPCAIVLRPTSGDFLNDYNNTTDLHIAVTTSTGCVVEFDRHGLRRHRTENMCDWWQCLLVGDVPEPWYDHWDQTLLEICRQPDTWTVSHYHEDKHNCYTFVLTFLQALTYDKLSEAATSKTRFCEKYIVPRTTTAGKYISLYRKLRDSGIYMHHTNHHKVRYAKQQEHQLQQRQDQQQPCQLKSNKHHNTVVTTTDPTTKNSSLPNKQQPNLKQQHITNHHNHQSIISRPHSTLCTIEE